MSKEEEEFSIEDIFKDFPMTMMKCLRKTNGKQTIPL